jgi:NAD(P)-dependent dehydrogenase (short-subunit alcohol dehydrogenase family)
MSMGKKLDGAVVVVTGASSGIGRATGLAFAERGGAGGGGRAPGRCPGGTGT